jgi:GNAT superfamily N-acetyltransferase
MTTPTSQIITADRHDLAPLTTVLIDAFFHTPDVTWALPDAEERATVLGRYVPAILHLALTHGSVHTTTARDAAAVWWPHHALDPDTYQALVTDTCGLYADTVLQVAALLADHQPDEPHHYLAYLGVAPQRQNTGTGTALLHHRHAALDAQGETAYLVATSQRSRTLYHRHGYTDLPHTPVQLPDGPALWPMRRPPRQPSEPSSTELPARACGGPR